MSKATSRASTLHDVAARVGVSPRTVSRVVNDQGGFSEGTRERVLEAVEALRYRPNAMARGLITRRSGTLAFIAPVLNDPFFPEVAEGVQRAASARDLTMLFAMTNNDLDTESDVLDRLEAHAPDGVIIFPAHASCDYLQTHLDRGTRMVVIDAPIDHPNATSIQSDLAHAGRLAVERLMQRGCRQLAMIASSQAPASQQRRHRAFLESIPTGMKPIVELEAPTFDGGRLGARQLIESHPEVDGIFAYNDVVAIGAIEEYRRVGLSIPDDVAIVGCDDIEMGSVVTPSLTTVRIDRERLGNEAVRALLALVEGEPSAPLVLPVEIVIRDSA